MIIDFRPKLHSENIEYYLHSFNEVQIEDYRVFILAEELVSMAYPTYEDKFDKRWESFYLPVKRYRKVIALPVWIMEYNKEFFVEIWPFGNINVKKGKDVLEESGESDISKELNVSSRHIDLKEFCENIFTEIIRFIPIIKKDENVLQKIIPYDIRKGKIKGCYVQERLISQTSKKEILCNYEKHIEKKLEIEEISLNDYLDTAKICYSIYQQLTGISNLDMYKRRADGRDGGMLSIKDWNSKKEFYDWYHSDMWGGSHPFEIVFSWHEHGIHLYPPNDLSHYYIISVTNYAYAWDFIEMVDKLIREQVPFIARGLDAVLDFLAGDTYFTVNKRGDHDLRYIPSKEYYREYFPHIEWDEIKIVKWK